MAKTQKDILFHDSIFKIIKELSQKENNSLGLSKVFKDKKIKPTAQTTINEYLNRLYPENYIIKSKHSTKYYEVNFSKIIKEFNIYSEKKYVVYFFQYSGLETHKEKYKPYYVRLLKASVQYGNFKTLKEVYDFLIKDLENQRIKCEINYKKIRFEKSRK